MQRRDDRLVDVLEDRRDAGREVVVQQHRAGVESVETHATTVAHDRFEHELGTAREFERRRFLHVREQGPDADLHAGLAKDRLQRRDVLEVEGVARVVLGDEQDAAGVGADLLDGDHHGLHAERHEFRCEIVEAAGEQVRVDGGELEPRVAQVDRCVERRAVLLPLAAQPVLDRGLCFQDLAFEGEQRAAERGREMGHGHGLRRARAGRDTLPETGSGRL